MPWLKINSRNTNLIFGIAKNEAVIIAMLHHPFLTIRIQLAVIKILIFNRNNINCKPCFMLTCSGYCNPLWLPFQTCPDFSFFELCYQTIAADKKLFCKKNKSAGSSPLLLHHPSFSADCHKPAYLSDVRFLTEQD